MRSGMAGVLGSALGQGDAKVQAEQLRALGVLGVVVGQGLEILLRRLLLHRHVDVVHHVGELVGKLLQSLFDQVAELVGGEPETGAAGASRESVGHAVTPLGGREAGSW